MEGDRLNRERSLRMVYEQNWLHFRHVENERLWFTNIFALMVAITFAFVAESGLRHEIWPLFLVLVVVSLLGLQITTKLSWAAFDLSTRIDAIVAEFDIGSFVSAPAGRSSHKSGLSGRIKRSAGFLFTVAFAFIIFYLVIFGLVLVLLIHTINLDTVNADCSALCAA